MVESAQSPVGEEGGKNTAITKADTVRCKSEDLNQLGGVCPEMGEMVSVELAKERAAKKLSKNQRR